MSIMKKIAVAVAAAVTFGFVSCTTDTEYRNIFASITATIDDVKFDKYAAAKVSTDNTLGSEAATTLGTVFGTDGTTICAGTPSGSGEYMLVTYRGTGAGTYKTGVASTDAIVTNLLGYLIDGNSTSVSSWAEAKSNVTYRDEEGVYWYSTLCTVKITSQENGESFSLINGEFDCDVYKKGDSTKKKHINGKIKNVIGLK